MKNEFFAHPHPRLLERWERYLFEIPLLSIVARQERACNPFQGLERIEGYCDGTPNVRVKGWIERAKTKMPIMYATEDMRRPEGSGKPIMLQKPCTDHDWQNPPCAQQEINGVESKNGCVRHLKEYDKENIARGVPLSKFLRRVMQVRNTEEESEHDAAANG